MLPIALASVLALAICIERAWALRLARITPPGLTARMVEWATTPQTGDDAAREFAGSPLGRVLLAGAEARRLGRERAKEAMEAAAASAVHDLERFLTTLGVIASATPLLGLLGTVLGMIRVFATLVEEGAASPALLAVGISEALVTTAAGISVAIPALVFHRALLRRVDALVVTMEGEASKLIDGLFATPETP